MYGGVPYTDESVHAYMDACMYVSKCLTFLQCLLGYQGEHMQQATISSLCSRFSHENEISP